MMGGDLETAVERMREVASLGASWAAAALTQLSGHPVSTRVPEVHHREHLERAGEWSTGLCFTTEGDTPGLVAVFMTPPTRDLILRQLIGNSERDASRPAVESVLKEFGNIIVSQAISAIANATGDTIWTSVPELLLEDAGAVFARRLPGRRHQGQGLLVETELFSANTALRALLVFAPDPKAD